MPRVFSQVFRGVSRGRVAGTAAVFALHLTLGGEVDICGRDDLFFCFSRDFGRKTDVTTFKEPVLLLRSENVSGPASMALNCAPPPLFKFLGNAQSLS